jgi:hypothetical protein
VDFKLSADLCEFGKAREISELRVVGQVQPTRNVLESAECAERGESRIADDVETACDGREAPKPCEIILKRAALPRQCRFGCSKGCGDEVGFLA